MCMAFFISSSILIGCGPPKSQTYADFNTANPTYIDVRRAIFQPICLECHNAGIASGGVVLESYDQVKSHVERIREVVLLEKIMPPTGPLRPDLQDLLKNWLDRGAPE